MTLKSFLFGFVGYAGLFSWPIWVLGWTMITWQFWALFFSSLWLIIWNDISDEFRK